MIFLLFRDFSPIIWRICAAVCRAQTSYSQRRYRHAESRYPRRALAGHAENARSGSPAYVRHVRRNRARARADGSFRLRDAAVRRLGHAVLPFPHEGQGSGLPGQLVRVSGRLCRHRAERRSRASPLCLRRRCRFRPAVSDSGGAGARLRREPRHALLPARRHRPDHHLHRHDAGQLRHQ